MYRYDEREYEHRNYRPPPIPLAPSPVCMGCQYNKMPYCFAPNSNDTRIDALPSNFICAMKTMDKKVETPEQVEKQASDILFLIQGIKTNNKLLKKIIKKMEKWD